MSAHGSASGAPQIMFDALADAPRKMMIFSLVDSNVPSFTNHRDAIPFLRRATYLYFMENYVTRADQEQYVQEDFFTPSYAQSKFPMEPPAPITDIFLNDEVHIRFSTPDGDYHVRADQYVAGTGRVKEIASDTFAEVDWTTEAAKNDGEIMKLAIRTALTKVNLIYVNAKPKKDAAGKEMKQFWHVDINLNANGIIWPLLPSVRVVSLPDGTQGVLKISRAFCVKKEVCHKCYKSVHACLPGSHDANSAGFKRAASSSFDAMFDRANRRRF